MHGGGDDGDDGDDDGEVGGEASSSSSATTSSAKSVSASALASKIASKLCLPEDKVLSARTHRNAVYLLRDLHAKLLAADAEGSETDGRDGHVASEERLFLLTAGVSVFRRWSVCDDDDDDKGLLLTTLGFLFAAEAMMVAKERRAMGGQVEAPEADEAAEMVDQTTRRSVGTRILQGEAEQAGEAGEAAEAAEAAEVPPLQTRRTLTRLLTTSRVAGAREKTTTLETLKADAIWFFAWTRDILQSQLLLGSSSRKKRRRDDFLTLDAASFVADCSLSEEERLRAVAEAGESELGQQILRDLILSFTLPRSVVGLRKAILLSRSASNAASSDHAILVQEAHDAAMAGCLHTFTTDQNPLHRMAALLAGLAIILSTSVDTSGDTSVLKTSDKIKHLSAFDGRVSLPFFACPTPRNERMPRIFYCEDTDTWTVYQIRHEKMCVHLSQRGLDGLARAVLTLLGTTSPAAPAASR